MAFTEENRIDIIQHVATLREYRDGSTLELNRVQQGQYPEKYDIRRWHIGEDGVKRPGRGVFLSDYELEELKAVLIDL